MALLLFEQVSLKMDVRIMRQPLLISYTKNKLLFYFRDLSNLNLQFMAFYF